MRVKDLLQERDADFSVIQNAFFDITDRFEDFHAACIPVTQVRPKELALIEAGIAQMGYGRNFTLRPRRLPAYNFLHGPILLGSSGFASLLYFTDIGIGLMCLPGRDGGTEFLRISACEMPAPPDEPERN